MSIPMNLHKNAPFDDLHAAKITSGNTASKPATPQGAGDVYWNTETNELSLPDAAGTGWQDYDLDDLGGGGGGSSTPQISYVHLAANQTVSSTGQIIFFDTKPIDVNGGFAVANHLFKRNASAADAGIYLFQADIGIQFASGHAGNNYNMSLNLIESENGGSYVSFASIDVPSGITSYYHQIRLRHVVNVTLDGNFYIEISGLSSPSYDITARSSFSAEKID